MYTNNNPAVTGSSKPKLFYGWIVLIAAMFIYAVAVGQSITYGIFIKPMCRDLGWDRAALTGAFGLYTIVLAFFSVVCGFLSDRVGPRALSVSGGIILGIGLFLSSRVNELWQFYFTYSFLRGIAFACIFVPLSSLIPRWFIYKKGLALGLFFASAGVGGLIMSPCLEYWVAEYGWRISFVILTVIACGVIIPSAFFLKKDPKEMGLEPLENGKTAGRDRAGRRVGESDYTVTQAIKTGTFWIFSISVMMIYTGIFMAQINMVPHATDRGIIAQTAAIALGIASAVNSIGRLLMGVISDKIGTKQTMSICIIIGAISLFWLVFVNKPWMMFIFAVLFGFAYGGIMPQIPRLISELFGVRSMGSILGVFTASVSLGPAIGPYVGGLIFDNTGSYTYAFISGGCALIAGFFLVMRIKLPGKRRA